MSEVVGKFYGPLSVFFAGLYRSFPDNERVAAAHRELGRSMSDGCPVLFRKLSPHCTKELSSAFDQRDPEAFFSAEKDNALVQFLGGREVYDCLTEEEQPGYWHSSLEEALNMGMLLNPFKDSVDVFDAIAERVRDSGKGGGGDVGSSAIECLLQDSDMFKMMSSMVVKPGVIEDMMQTLPVVWDKIDGSSSSSDSAQVQSEEVVTAEGGELEPSHVFRSERRKYEEIESNQGNSIKKMLAELPSDKAGIDQLRGQLSKSMDNAEDLQVATSTILGMLKKGR